MPQAQSIDNFIDSHRSDGRVAQCGKLAIAPCILKAERGSALQVDRSNIYNRMNFTGVSNTWFTGLFQLIVQSCQQEEVAARLQKLAVVSFNDDRCLEHFRHGALQNNLELRYGVKAQKATASDARVYATALGLSDSDARLIEGDLEILGGYNAENVNLHKALTAAALFREYTRSLSLQ